MDQQTKANPDVGDTEVASFLDLIFMEFVSHIHGLKIRNWLIDAVVGVLVLNTHHWNFGDGLYYENNIKKYDSASL